MVRLFGLEEGGSLSLVGGPMPQYWPSGGEFGSFCCRTHASCPSLLRISSSIAFRVAPSSTLHPSSSTLDVSIVQYSVSVIADAVVFVDRLWILLGRELGGVRATSA